MTLFVYVVESQLCICALYALYRLFLRKKIAYNLSRVYLLSVVPFSMLLPFINIPVNVSAKTAETITYLVSYLPPVFVKGAPEKVVSTGLTTGTFSGDLLFLVYLLGLFFLAGLFFYRLYQSYIVLRSATRRDFEGKTIFLSKEGRGAFAIFGRIVIEEGMFRKYDRSRFLPHIVHHEAVHCKLMHTADLVFMLIQKMFLWFNPLIWHIEKQLKENHEYEVDDKLIRSGVEPRQYAQLLIDFEMGFNEPYPISSFSYLSIKNRIEMMTKMNVKKRNMRMMLALPVMCILVAIFSLTSNYYAFSQPRSVPDNAASGLSLPAQDDTVKTVETLPLATVDIKPQFMGGDMNTFTRWVFEQVKYPQNAFKNKKQGRVTLQFSVTKTGKVADVKVVSGVDKELDDEAVRVIASSPDWTPGVHKGKPVQVRMTFPIIFLLK